MSNRKNKRIERELEQLVKSKESTNVTLFKCSLNSWAEASGGEDLYALDDSSFASASS